MSTASKTDPSPATPQGSTCSAGPEAQAATISPLRDGSRLPTGLLGSILVVLWSAPSAVVMSGPERQLGSQLTQRRPLPPASPPPDLPSDIPDKFHLGALRVPFAPPGAHKAQVPKRTGPLAHLLGGLGSPASVRSSSSTLQPRPPPARMSRLCPLPLSSPCSSLV